MNTQRILLLAAGVIGAAALFITARTARHNVERECQRAAQLDERAQSAALTQTATDRLTAAEAQRASLQAALAGLRASKPAQTAPAAAHPQPTNRPGAGAPTANSRENAPPLNARQAAYREQLLRDPETQIRWAQSQRPTMTRLFAPLFNALQLSPEQIEKFVTAFVTRNEQLLDLTAAGEAQGPEARTAVAELEKRAHAEFDSTLREVLGPQGWLKYREFQRMKPAREVIKELAATTTFGGEPLTAAQGEQLMRAMAKASSVYARGGQPAPETINWQAVDAQARQFLTPAQLGLFQRVGGRLEAELDTAIARAKKAEMSTAPAKGAGTRG